MKRSNQRPSTCSDRRSAAAGITGYFDLRRKALESRLKAARDFYAVDGIHELRVEIKRMRALYELIDYAVAGFAVKPEAYAFKPLFRAAGRLRDIDIQQAIIVPYLRQYDLREFYNELKRREIEYRPSFAQTIDLFTMSVLVAGRSQIRSAVAATPGNQLRKRMTRRLLKRASQLVELTGKSRPDCETLHLVRKSAKRVRYCLELWQACYGPTHLGNSAVRLLKSSAGVLGEWHDTLLTLESVESFLSETEIARLVDVHGYRRIRRDLKNRAGNLLIKYDRGLLRLRRALSDLVDGLKAQLGDRSSVSR